MQSHSGTHAGTDRQTQRHSEKHTGTHTQASVCVLCTCSAVMSDFWQQLLQQHHWQAHNLSCFEDTHSSLMHTVQSSAPHLVSKAGTEGRAGTAHLCHECCACERALTPAHGSHGHHTAHLLQVRRSHASQLGPHRGWPRLLLIH